RPLPKLQKGKNIPEISRHLLFNSNVNLLRLLNRKIPECVAGANEFYLTLRSALILPAFLTGGSYRRFLPALLQSLAFVLAGENIKLSRTGPGCLRFSVDNLSELAFEIL